MKDRATRILYVFFLTSILISILLTLISGIRYKQDGCLFSGRISELSSGWQTSDGRTVSLPIRLQPNAQGEAILTRALPASLQEGSTLLLKTNYQSFSVYAGDKLLYSWKSSDSSSSGLSFGLGFNIVSLPSSAAGETLEVRLSQTQNGGIWIYRAQLGTGADIAALVFRNSLMSLALSLVLSAALLIILISLFFYRSHLSRKGVQAYVLLSCFIILSVAWITSDSDLALLLTPNAAFLLYCSTLSLMLLPVPLLLYIRLLCTYGKRLIDLLAGAVLINFAVCVALHVFGAADLLTTLPSSHVLAITIVVSILLLCLRNRSDHGKQEMTELAAGLLILCLCSAAAVTKYYVSYDPDSNNLFCFGLAAFILLIGLGASRRHARSFIRTKSFAEMVSSIPGGICRIESLQTGLIVSANNFFYRMFGYTETAAEADGFTHIGFTVLPEDKPVMAAAIRECLTRKKTHLETEIRHVRKNGDIIWVMSRFQLEGGAPGEINAVMIDITDRKEAEERLRISEEENRIAAAHSGKIIIRFDVKTRTCYRQNDPLHLIGLEPVIENVPESIIESGLVAQESVPAFLNFSEAILRGDRQGSTVISFINRLSGESKWYRLDFTGIFNARNEPIQAVISMDDVTLQRQKELAFQRWQQSYNAIPKEMANYYEHNLTIDLCECENGCMLPSPPADVPRTLASMARYLAQEHVHPDDRAAFSAFLSRERLLGCYSAGQYSDETEFRRLSSGMPKWTSLALQLIPDPYSSYVKACFLLKDIDKRKRQEIRLRERSTIDSLTGILNRATVVERIGEIFSASYPPAQHALIMMDIDNFKTINDTLGHTAGDTILARISGKLKLALRADDLCGRLGGDEFVILLKNMNPGEPLKARVRDLAVLIGSIRLQGIAVSASFGVATYPQDGLTFEELYRKADTALYSVKSRERGGYALYDQHLGCGGMSLNTRQ